MAILPLAMMAVPAHAQNGNDAPKGLDAYRAELVAYQWGGILYCHPDGTDTVLKRADRRLGKIRVALEARYGPAAVAGSREAAIREFDEQYGTSSPAGCRIGDKEEDLRNFRQLSRDHDARLDALERELGLRK